MPSYAIIGASRGIGLEFVRQLAADADNIVFAVVRDERASTHLAALTAQLSTKNLHVMEADVVDHQALKIIAGRAAEITGGPLDVLVHSAARQNNTTLYRGFADYENDDELDKDVIEYFRVNALGVVHSINAFLPLLRKGQTKKIILMHSGAGDRELIWAARADGIAAYGISRAASDMVVTKYAALLEGEGFIVTAILPGMVDVSATAVDKPDDAAKAARIKLMAGLRKIAPDFKPNLVTPEHAVSRMLRDIDSLSLADNGNLQTLNDLINSSK